MPATIHADRSLTIVAPANQTRAVSHVYSARATATLSVLTRHADEPANRSHTRNLQEASGKLASSKPHAHAPSLRRTVPAVHAPMPSYGSVPAETKQHAAWLCSAPYRSTVCTASTSSIYVHSLHITMPSQASQLHSSLVSATQHTCHGCRVRGRVTSRSSLELSASHHLLQLCLGRHQRCRRLRQAAEGMAMCSCEHGKWCEYIGCRRRRLAVTARAELEQQQQQQQWQRQEGALSSHQGAGLASARRTANRRAGLAGGRRHRNRSLVVLLCLHGWV